MRTQLMNEPTGKLALLPVKQQAKKQAKQQQGAALQKTQHTVERACETSSASFRFGLQQLKIAVLAAAFGLTACGSSSKSGQSHTPGGAGTIPTASSNTAPPITLPSTIEEAVGSDLRTASNRERDMYRHPTETLGFFGLKPDMTVVEVSPGAGWYMEILAPLMVKSGHYILAAPSNPEGAKTRTIWMSSHPQIAAKITTSVFELPTKAEIAPPGTADMVLTFRNVHNWMSGGNQTAAFQAFFKALKPGGILGVVEHRGKLKKKQDPKAESGYVREADVIKFAQKAGFKLDAKSEINANPKDTKNYPEGVWTLPPSFALKDKDHDKYKAIGESDRMTLRFIKPAK